MEGCLELVGHTVVDARPKFTSTEARGARGRDLCECRLVLEERRLGDALRLVGPGERYRADLGIVSADLCDRCRVLCPDLLVSPLGSRREEADEVHGLLDERGRVRNTEALLDGQGVVARVVLVVEERALRDAFGDDAVELEAVVAVPEALGLVVVVIVRVLEAVVDAVQKLDLLLEFLVVGIKLRAEVAHSVVPVEVLEVLEGLLVGEQPLGVGV